MGQARWRDGTAWDVSRYDVQTTIYKYGIYGYIYGGVQTQRSLYFTVYATYMFAHTYYVYTVTAPSWLSTTCSSVCYRTLKFDVWIWDWSQWLSLTGTNTCCSSIAIDWSLCWYNCDCSATGVRCTGAWGSPTAYPGVDSSRVAPSAPTGDRLAF